MKFQHKIQGKEIILPLGKTEVVEYRHPRVDQWIANHKREVTEAGGVPKIVSGTGHRPKDFPRRSKTTFEGPVRLRPEQVKEILAKPAKKQDAAFAYAYSQDPMGLCLGSTMRTLVNEIATELQRIGATAVIGGGAMGFDQLIVAAARQLELPYMVFIPLETQADRWPEYVQKGWLTQATQAGLVVMTGHNYEAMQEGATSPLDTDRDLVSKHLNRRNNAMLSKADEVVALWNGKRHGGTYNCIKAAKRMGMTVHNLYEVVINAHVRPEYRGEHEVYAPEPRLDMSSAFHSLMKDVKRHDDFRAARRDGTEYVMPAQDMNHDPTYGPNFSYTRLQVNRASDFDLQVETEETVQMPEPLAPARIYTDIPF